MAWNNKPAQNNTQQNEEFNVCKNWGLHCHETKEIKNKDGQELGVALRCTLNGKKKQDGTYPKSMPVTVNCYYDSVKKMPDEDPSGKKISVNGRFAISEYTNKDKVTVPQYSITAEEVVIREVTKK